MARSRAGKRTRKAAEQPAGGGTQAREGEASARGTQARTHAVVQRTLERYPWATLAAGGEGDQFKLDLLLDAAGEEGRRWFVRTSDGGRLPAAMDVDVYVALGQLYNSQIPRDRRATDRTIHTTLGELTGIMGRDRGGMTYRLVEAALFRLASVRITAVQTWRSGDTRGTVEDFALLGSVKFGLRRDGDHDRTAVRVRFSEELAQSIADGHFRLLDVGVYFALDTPTAKRLFRWLDARRWRGHERQDVLAVPLRQLAKELPIDRAAPSHIKRTLDPAHESLVRNGYLLAADYEERPVPGKQRGVWWCRYTFAQAQPAGRRVAVVESGQERGGEQGGPAQTVAETVAEILAVLRDSHSAGFYKLVAERVPLEMIRGVLGGARQIVTEGGGLELARKTFTATIKRRATAAGIAL